MARNIFKKKLQRTYQMTHEGMIELQSRLKALLGQRREIRERLHNLREEQASDSYDWSDTMRSLEFLDTEIERTELVLQQALVVELPTTPTAVEMGTTIELEDGEQMLTYRLVSPLEADPLNGKISHESPLGKALLGKKPNQLVKFLSPKKGLLRYKIIRVH